MNVAQLKEELEQRGIQPLKKHKKKDLQKTLREAVKNNIRFASRSLLHLLPFSPPPPSLFLPFSLLFFDTHTY